MPTRLCQGGMYVIAPLFIACPRCADFLQIKAALLGMGYLSTNYSCHLLLHYPDGELWAVLVFAVCPVAMARMLCVRRLGRRVVGPFVSENLPRRRNSSFGKYSLVVSDSRGLAGLPPSFLSGLRGKRQGGSSSSCADGSFPHRLKLGGKSFVL